ncbi:MAG: prepilin peptidase [Patescibacteria group bacterium]
MDLILQQFGIFVFGALIGSFLNVVILRYGKKSLNGRSQCMLCKKQLSWYELIPVLSFLFLKGKCKNCKQKISWQYPLVEIATAIMFLSVFNLFAGGWVFTQFSILQFFNLITLWIIVSVLIVIFVYDIYHKIIPDFLVFAFAVIALLRVFLIDFQGFSFSSAIWAGPLLAFPFVFLWVISRGRWIGLGDAKLAVGIGWFLGLAQGSSAIILAVWTGAIVGLVLVGLSRLMTKTRLSFVGKTFTIKSELPFAPFLILGTILVFFLEWDVWGLSLIIGN